MKRTITTLLFLSLLITANAQDFRQQVSEALTRDNYQSVIDNTTKWLSVEPKSAEAYYRRALAYVGIKTYGKAINDMGMSIKCWSVKDTFATLSDIYCRRAEIFILVADTANALADYSVAIAKDSANAQLHLTRARLYDQLLDVAKAEADYREAVRLTPGDADTELLLAQCLEKQNKDSETLTLLKQVVRLNPENAEAKKLLALLYRKTGNLHKFFDCYVEYLEMSDAGDSDLLVNASVDDYDYAVSAIHTVLQTSRSRAYWLSIETKVHRANGKPEEAVKSLREMEKLNADSTLTLFISYQMAYCFSELCDFTNALKYFNILIECEEKDNSVDAEDLVARGWCYECNGNLSKALQDYSRAITIDKENPGYLLKLGNIHEKMNDYQSAFDDYNKAITLSDNIPLAFLLRGRLSMCNLNDTLSAKSDFETVLRLDTLVSLSSYKQFALHFLNRDDEAKVWMDSILALDTTNADSYYLAACLYSLINEGEKSVVYLKKAIDLGFRNYSYIQLDRDLANIRDREDYKALMDQYKQFKLKRYIDGFKPVK